MLSSLLRNLPPFKGKQRIARVVLKQTIANGQDIIVRGKYDCTFKLPNLIENIGFEIFINGIYEIETIDLICSQMNPGEVFLDIGANIGGLSVPVAKRRRDVKLVCVEAAPWIFEYLEYNIRVNDITNITTLNRAIADGTLKEVTFYSPHEKFGKGSLSPVFTKDGVNVETVTLDYLAGLNPGDKIGLIKIDVEGFEYYAFLGGKKLLTGDAAPDILFEFVDWAESQAPDLLPGSAQRLLIDYGYSIYHLHGNKPGRKLQQPVVSGTYMLFASKKSF